ncbi:MAG TPA: TSUP family transporter, partial [Candidatus Methylomirabilis sp.]
MEPISFFAILFGASVLAGALGALLGLGGGVIVVPVLTLMAGLNIHYAIGASIVSVIATSSGAAATYVRDRITNLRLG